MLYIYYKTKNSNRNTYRFCSEVLSSNIYNELTTDRKNLIAITGNTLYSCTQTTLPSLFVKEAGYQGLIGIISSGN